MEPQASEILENIIQLKDNFNNQISISDQYFRVNRTHFDGGKLDQVEFNAQSIPKFKESFLLQIIPYNSRSETRFRSLCKLCHPNILSHHNVWINSLSKPANPWEDSEDENSTEQIEYIPSPRPHLVCQMESFNQINLKQFLSSRTTNPSPTQIEEYYVQTQQIFIQILDAFVYLELAGIVHGNLKLEDILIRPSTQSDQGLLIKVSGFGKMVQDPEDFDDLDDFIVAPQEDYSAGAHSGDLYALAVVLISLLVQRKDGESLSEAVGNVLLSLVHKGVLTGLENYPQECDWILKMTKPEIFLRPKFTLIKHLVSEVPGYRRSFDGEALKLKTLGIDAVLKFCRMVVLKENCDEKVKFRIGVDDKEETDKVQTNPEPQPGPSSKIMEMEADQEDPEVIQEQLRQLEEIRTSQEFQQLDLLDAYRIEVESSIISLKCSTFFPNPNHPFDLKGQKELETGLTNIRQIYLAQKNILKLSPNLDLQTLNTLITETKILTRLGRIGEAEGKWHDLEKLFCTLEDTEICPECQRGYDQGFRDFQVFLLKSQYSRHDSISRWITLNGLHVKSIQENMAKHLCSMLHEGVPIFDTRDPMLTENLTLLAKLEGQNSPCYKSALQQLAAANKDKLRRLANEPIAKKPETKPTLPVHWQNPVSSILKKNFNLVQILGKGSYGTVHRAVKPNHTGDKYDVIQFDSEGSPQFTKDFAIKIIPYGEISEASFSIQLVHPNIVSCYNVWSDNFNPDSKFEYESGSSTSTQPSTSTSYSSGYSDPHPNMDNLNYFKSSKNLVIQQELCTGSTLEDLLQLRNPDPDAPTMSRYYQETQSIFAQLLEALIYLEIKEIAHGDLKPDNVILVPVNGTLVPKILDFGKANFTMPFATGETDEKLNKSVQNRRRYISPEQGKVENSVNLGTLGASHKSNVYSLGLMLIPMLIQFKFEINPRTRALISIQLNSCLEDVRQIREKRIFPEELVTKYPMEFGWIQAMVDHDYRRRPAASEVKRMVKQGQGDGYKILSPAIQGSQVIIKNMDSIFNKVIGDSASKCKYETIDIDREISQPMTKQGAIEKCIENNLGRYLNQFMHLKLATLAADDKSIVDTFRTASKMGLCPAQDLHYLIQRYLHKIETELSTDHELFSEFTTILEEIKNIPPISLTNMKHFIGNMFNTGVSMQDIIPRLEPNPDTDTIEELMSMWSCTGFGKTLTDETHHENRDQIEAAYANISSLNIPQSGTAQGISAKMMNLMTRAQMLNKLNRTEEIEGITKEAFQNLEFDGVEPEFQARFLENFGQFLKSFDMKDLLPMVEQAKEMEGKIKSEIGSANLQNEVAKYWNQLGCKCVKCQRKMDDSESQVANEILEWSTTMVQKQLTFESRNIDELD